MIYFTIPKNCLKLIGIPGSLNFLIIQRHPSKTMPQHVAINSPLSPPFKTYLLWHIFSCSIYFGGGILLFIFCGICFFTLYPPA